MAKLKNINIRFTIIKIIKSREVQIMKTLIKFAVIPLFVLTACTSANQLSSAYDDDGVYSSKKDKPSLTTPTNVEKQIPAKTDAKPVVYQEVTAEKYKAGEQAVDKSQMSYDKYKQSQAENTNAVVENNTAEQTETVNNQENQNYSDYDADDYYDYGYSSRLRRFHNPCHFSSYYDDYYTNMYWYNYDPFYYGTSIYMGYNWWSPGYSYYNPYYYNNWGWNLGFGLGLGWGYYGMGYYGWNTPYYWGGGYYGYGYGYGYGNHGHGYIDDSWASNSNSSSTYYGPRNYIGSSNGTTTPRGTATNNGGVKSNANVRINSVDNFSKRIDTKTPVNDSYRTSNGTADQKPTTVVTRNEGITPNNTTISTPDSRELPSGTDSRLKNPASGSEVKVESNYTNRTDNQNNVSRSYTPPANQSNPNARINNYQRYSRSGMEKQTEKPATTTPNTYNYREPKSYRSPAYSQPRSSQEFESPKYKREGNYSTRPTQTQPANNQESPRTIINRNYSQPSNSNRSYSPPANNQNRNYTPPANNENRNYTPPSNSENRNYSQPSNNNNSYSAPAPSRSTYTAPSNSGGSNSRSGGNSSGSENQKRR